MPSRRRPKPALTSPGGGKRWRLQDARAQLSEVVRLAHEEGPQRLTVRGKDAAVIVAPDEFDRLQRPVTGRDIVDALSQSPLQDIEFERASVRSPIRNAEV